ncbi:MAG: sigma-54-dependent Fis family transcriptional regulator [Deltaproteobacteria bacterium]|nr:sigma-54-dependent Fis family transcriptional regulator [Deltaproteobacteria bacterium]
MDKIKILIVDDEKTLCESFSQILREEGYEADVAFDGEQALDKIQNQIYDVVFCDLRMPKIDGLQVLEKIESVSPQTFFIVMTAYGSRETTLEAIHKGAYDYVTKPLVFDDILLKLKHLLNFKKLNLEQRLLSGYVTEQFAFDNVLGQGPEMKAIYSLMQQVARSAATVLISGEQGVGKERLARAIHYQSGGKIEGFHIIRCGSYNEKQLDESLFGVKGVFLRKAKGTLLLDEIETLDLSLQEKLVKFLHAGGVMDNDKLRLIISTSQDLMKEVAKGNVREDLFFKINSVELKIPPLRARKNDIPFITKYFVRVYSEEFCKKIRYVTEPALEVLMNYPWKGNVRELQNVLERAILLSDTTTQFLDLKDLPSELVSIASRPSQHNFKDAMRYYEMKHIQWVLEKNRFDKKKTANDLGLSLSSLYRKIEELSMAPLQ